MAQFILALRQLHLVSREYVPQARVARAAELADPLLTAPEVQIPQTGTKAVHSSYHAVILHVFLILSFVGFFLSISITFISY